jgi:hypothetical protein
VKNTKYGAYYASKIAGKPTLRLEVHGYAALLTRGYVVPTTLQPWLTLVAAPLAAIIATWVGGRLLDKYRPQLVGAFNDYSQSRSKEHRDRIAAIASSPPNALIGFYAVRIGLIVLFATLVPSTLIATVLSNQSLVDSTVTAVFVFALPCFAIIVNALISMAEVASYAETEA